MSFSSPKTPKTPAEPPPKTKVESISEEAKRATLYQRRKTRSGAAGTMLSRQQQDSGVTGVGYKTILG